MKKAITFGSIVVGLVLSLSGCQSTTMHGVSSERKQLMLYSEKEYLSQSESSYRNIINHAKQRGLLTTNNQVNRVSQNLIQKVHLFRPDAKNWNWEVHTIRDKEVNAFCLSGGKIGILTGMLTELNLNDQELAAIISHEIAHALKDHGREKVSKKMMTGLGVLAASSLGLGDIAVGATSIIGDYGINLPGSRKLEIEADLLGLELMVAAGYSTTGAIGFWEKVIKHEKNGSSLDFMSTHPQSEKRLILIKEHIKKMNLK